MSALIGESMTGGYGGADVLQGCTIGVEAGEIAVIVGPNGAGKSTAMKAVFGMLELRKGKVTVNGKDITALSPQARVREGMAFVPQTRNVFTSMSVEENLEMGAFIREDSFADTPTGLRLVSGVKGEAPPTGRRTIRRSAPTSSSRSSFDDPTTDSYAR